MMGVNMGYRPAPRQSIAKKYAWLPVKTNSNKWVWFEEYYKIETYYDENGKPPIKSLTWDIVLTKNEYLIWCIKNTVTETKLVTRRSAEHYYKEF